MPGYSKTPLVKKLGLKTGMRAFTIAAPEDYLQLLNPMPADVLWRKRLAHPTDFIHIFATRRKALDKALARAMRALASDGIVWVSWPKGSSGVATELSGGVVRTAGQAAGLVDIKVCAVDDTWSGHKFVIPLADRRGR